MRAPRAPTSRHAKFCTGLAQIGLLATLYSVDVLAQEAFSSADEARQAAADGQRTYDENQRCTQTTQEQLAQLQRGTAESFGRLKTASGVCQQALNEFGQGRYCARCLRSASEVVAQTNQAFESHVSNPQARPVPASSRDVGLKLQSCRQEVTDAAARVGELRRQTESAAGQWQTCEAARVAAWTPTRTAEAWHLYLTNRERLGRTREQAARREELRRLQRENATQLEALLAARAKGPSPGVEAQQAELLGQWSRSRQELDASLGQLARDLGGDTQEDVLQAQALVFANALAQRLAPAGNAAAESSVAWKPPYPDAPLPDSLAAEVRAAWEHLRALPRLRATPPAAPRPGADGYVSPAAACLAALPAPNGASIDEALGAILRDAVPPPGDPKQHDRADVAVNRYWRLLAAAPGGVPAVRRALHRVQAHRVSLLIKELDQTTEVTP